MQNMRLGQSAGKLSLANAVAASMPAVYTTNEDFALKVTTAPATGASSVTIKGWYKFHYQGMPTTLV